MKADAKTETEVKAVLKRLAECFGSRDLNGFMGCFVPDDDLVLYGTGADEKRIGPKEVQAQLTRDWEQSESASLAFPWVSVSSAGVVAWAAADGIFHVRVGDQDLDIHVRVSFVLEKRDEVWRIGHAHFSTPAAGQAEGESY